MNIFSPDWGWSLKLTFRNESITVDGHSGDHPISIHSLGKSTIVHIGKFRMYMRSLGLVHFSARGKRNPGYMSQGTTSHIATVDTQCPGPAIHVIYNFTIGIQDHIF
ncbi:unnamed protein product [Orchesella dallaii]|uniref:Uncharacterized protein n=1 Tax=Orchesella dallaii TaxID=48710 RepID=A0ABP1S1U1_9HEXA